MNTSPPYKAAVDAGVGLCDGFFNEVDGILQQETNGWWQMFLEINGNSKVSWWLIILGINEMIDHGMGDLQQVSALAMNAGVDMDMVGEGFLTTLKNLYKKEK